MKNFSTLSGGPRTRVLAAVFASALAFSGCKKDDAPPEPVGNANVMFVHAATNASDIDVYVGQVRQPSPLASLSNTGYVSVEAGNKKVELNEASKLTPYTTVNQDFRKNAHYSVFAFNRIPSVESLVVIDSLDKTTTAAGRAFVRLIHLAPDAPNVSVALADNGTIRQTVIPNTKYKAYSAFREIPAGSTSLALVKEDLTAAYVTPSAQNFVANRFYTLVAQGFVNGKDKEALTVRVIENVK